MVAFKLTVPFIRTGARESSSWPGVRSTSRPDTFLQTTSDNLEFLLDAERRAIHFLCADKIRLGIIDHARDGGAVSNCNQHSRGARRVRPAPCGQLPTPAWLVQMSSRKGVWDAAVERLVEIVYKVVQARECEARR
jgi:hypothetical protein